MPTLLSCILCDFVKMEVEEAGALALKDRNAQTIVETLEQYYANDGTYPASLAELVPTY
jgi:hypothetical protein